MIAPMTRYAFILLKGEERGLLEKLQELGLVDISRTARPVDAHSEELAREVERLDGLIRSLRRAEIPENTAPVPVEGAPETAARELLERQADLTQRIGQQRKEAEALRVWGRFDPSLLQRLEEAGVPVRFHCLAGKAFREEWAESCALSVIARDKGKVWFVVAGDDPLPGEIPAPRGDAARAEAALRALEQEESVLLGHLAGVRERIGEIEALRAQTYAQLDLYLAGQTAVSAAEDSIVTLVGYSTTETEAAVTAALDQTGVFYFKAPAAAEDNPPVALKNNWFVRQFEVLTDMYGRPAYDGFDPTPYISVFFLLFFAFCMGDCGYGLILLAAGLLLRKTERFKDMAPLVTLLGAGTTVIGFLFHTFFSVDISGWEIFRPVRGIFLPGKIAGYDGTMVLSIIVGVFHLCLAMCVKTYEETRHKGFLNVLGTWGWTLLLVGGVITGALALTGVLDKTITRWTVIVLGTVSALGIFVFNDPKRSKLVNVGAGLWDTYNTVSGLLGDVLSYLRLYALGLAGSMLGLAFNSIGLMILGDGSQPLLWIPFVAIVVIGHTLNIAMAALGAFVHPLRLNFLEFFKNSGYEARGRNFNPLSK